MALIEFKEAFLIRPNLMNIDVVKARFHERRDFLDMTFRIGTAGDLLRYIFFTHHLSRLLKKRGAGKLLRQLALDTDVGPVLMGHLPPRCLILSPTDGELTITRFTVSTSLLKMLNNVLHRGDIDEAVPDAT